jgi:hypothetical protein
MYTLATLATILLLPIVPAFLLFWALPSNAVVSGPLQGLKINLGGAFGAYFALVVLVLGTHSVWNPPPTPPAYQAWEVKGQIADNNGNPIEPLDVQDVAVVPSDIQRYQQGMFQLDFLAVPGENGGIDYPSLVISHKNFKAVTISLNPANAQTLSLASVDSVHHEILINALRLQPPPPYQAAAALNAPQAPVPGGHQ